MWVVVPVKRFSNAKTRLAPLLSAAERESLAQAMLNDVLRAIAESRRVAGVLVVSREVRARSVRARRNLRGEGTPPPRKITRETSRPRG